MTQKDVVEQCPVNLGLLEELFNPCEVFCPPHAGGDGDQMLDPESSAGHVFIYDGYRRTHRLLNERVCSQPLDGKPSYQHMLTLD